VGGQIDLQAAHELVVVGVEGGALILDAGIGVDHVQAAEGSHGGGDERRHLLRVCHVCGDGVRAAAGRRDRLGPGLTAGPVAIGQHHGRAFLCEQPGGGRADT